MADQKLNIQIRAFDKTKSAFNGVTKSIRAVGRAIFSMKTALAGVIGLTGIGLLVRQSLQATDVLAKTANKIGTTTESLSRLRFAAEQTGVATATMDMALQRFVRRTAEAARGTGEAKGALRELNLDARELLEMPLDQQMIALSDAFKTLPTDADKVRVAMKLFDSEGVALVGTLKAGAEGITAMFNEAEKLGIVMSGTAAAGVERANDALNRLFSVFKGVKDQIVAALAPAIERLATIVKDKLVASINSVNGDMTAFAELIRTKILDSIVGFLRLIANLVEGLERAADAATYVYLAFKRWQEQSDAPIEFASNVGTFSGAILNAAISIQQFNASLGSLPATFGKIKDPLKDTRTLADDLKDAFSTASDALPSLQEGLTSVANVFANQFTAGLTDAIDGTKKASDAFKDMARSVVRSLTQMLLQYYITKPLFDLITGSIGGGGNSGSADTSSATVNAGMQSGFEVGSSVEPFRMSPASKPSVSMNGGSGTVNQTINVTTGVQQTVRAEIQNMMPQIQEATKAAVADSRARGGSYSKALVGR